MTDAQNNATRQIATAREARLTATFVALADTLVDEYDILDLLDMLVNTCADVLDASAAGLVLADDSGSLSVVASTSERTKLVEIMQLDSDGPCIECFRTGNVMRVPEIGDVVERWPQFSTEALAQGFRAVHAVPLRLRGTVLGALNLFHDDPGLLSDEDASVARGLADVASIGLVHERTLRESNATQQQLQRALDSRVLIEQAKGVIAHTHQTDVERAFEILRAYARSKSLPLREVAAQVVARAIRI